MTTGAELVSAAIRAAVLANAPRRTVAAVAAAAIGSALSTGAGAVPETVPGKHAMGQRASGSPHDEDATLVEALRHARRERRKRKIARRRAAAMEAKQSPTIGRNDVDERCAMAVASTAIVACGSEGSHASTPLAANKEGPPDQDSVVRDRPLRAVDDGAIRSPPPKVRCTSGKNDDREDLTLTPERLHDHNLVMPPTPGFPVFARTCRV